MDITSFPKSVKIVEVGPRDGLQNEVIILPEDVKIEFINRLSETGLTSIEATSFVSPRWIPQLEDHEYVYKNIKRTQGISYSVFVPNVKGLKRALVAGVNEIAVFTTPSEEFCKKNVNLTVEESLKEIAEMSQIARSEHVEVRGYISCVMGSPYEGEISPESVADLAEKLINLGCYEVSLGDTIGKGTPLKTKALLDAVLAKVPKEKIAVHFHDTFGLALVNIFVALEKGIAVIDSSVAGLGGCPYARGASGNVATEEVLYLLEGMGIETGVDLKKIIEVGRYITAQLKKSPISKVNRAMA